MQFHATGLNQDCESNVNALSAILSFGARIVVHVSPRDLNIVRHENFIGLDAGNRAELTFCHGGSQFGCAAEVVV
jgi:hypothetical protein